MSLPGTPISEHMEYKVLSALGCDLHGGSSTYNY